MTWLLDTNAWISFFKPGNPAITERISNCHEDDLVLCSIVKAELWHGAHKYELRDQRLQLLSELFSRHRSLPFDDIAAWHYAEIRHELEAAGCVIGPNDLKIAAICRAHGVTLVTANTGEFSRVTGLAIENWNGGPTPVSD